MRKMSKDQTEEEFLKNYNPRGYDPMAITSDILILSVSNKESENYRKLDEKQFSVLLVKRETHPFKGKWCLPGGFIGVNETLDEAAKRILREETNLKNIYLEQLYTFSDVDRDPRMRILSTAYMSLIDKNMLEDKLFENAKWFDLTVKEKEIKPGKSEIYILLENGEVFIEFELEKIRKEETSNIYEYKIRKNDKLAFDHPLVIATGIDRLKNKVEYTDVVFNMMPEYFTLRELQQVYESILGRELIVPDFRRRIKDKVEKTEQIAKGAGHRPSALYRYKRN
ncbi:MAG: NUDIX hydrolase [Clostridia bacterium]|nr:NUDIX hydrolase [Clostridia bacterium]